MLFLGPRAEKDDAIILAAVRHLHAEEVLVEIDHLRRVLHIQPDMAQPRNAWHGILLWCAGPEPSHAGGLATGGLNVPRTCPSRTSTTWRGHERRKARSCATAITVPSKASSAASKCSRPSMSRWLSGSSKSSRLQPRSTSSASCRRV